MPLSPFEKVLPWSGVLAGVLFVVQEAVAPFGEKPNDPHLPGRIADAVARGYIAGFASLLGAVMLYFFAGSVRASQRTGEAGESTYSSVAYGGLIGAGAGLGIQGFAQVALTSAADAGQTAVTQTLVFLAFYAWLPILAGLVPAFWGIGLGGLRNATTPKWFAIVSVVLAVIGVLGPLAAVVQIVLPLWLIAAAVIITLGQRRAGGPDRVDRPADPAVRGTKRALMRGVLLRPMLAVAASATLAVTTLAAPADAKVSVAGVALTGAATAQADPATGGTWHGSIDATGSVFHCSGPTGDIVVTSGTVTATEHWTVDAVGNYHITDLFTASGLSAQDASGDRYIVSGVSWFGGSVFAQTFEFTDTEHFVLKNVTSGGLVTVQIVTHISPNGSGLTLDAGACEPPD